MLDKKGVDTHSLNYGIRREDMRLIETLCAAHQIDFEWVKEDLLRAFHDKKIQHHEMDSKIIERLLNTALLKIK